jgi:hypothetical protein
LLSYGSATLTVLWIALPIPASLAKKPPKPVKLKVNTTTDSAGVLHGKKLCGKKAGQCSLRAAVEEADKPKPGKTYAILLPAGDYVLTLGPLAITQGSVVIEGAGSASTAISGGGTSQILTVAAGADLSIQSVTLTEGAGEEPGGALENRGAARVLDSVVSRSSGGEGGGIYNASGATLEIQESTLTEDSTDEGRFYGEELEQGGNGGDGGAIANAGTLTIKGGAISASYAGRGAFSNGNGGGTGGNGGGIFNTGTAALTNVSLESDFAGSGGLGYNEPSGAGGGGGGIYNQGGTVTVNGGAFTGNSSGAAGYNLTDPEGRAPGDGGGIDNVQGTAHIQGTSFTANAGGLGRFTTGGSGGAIANSANLTVAGATFEGNTAGTGGYGGTGGNGAALYNTGSGSVTTSSFLHNTAGLGGESLPGGAGGAVFNTGTLEVNASTLAFDAAGAGGAGGARDPGPGAPGGLGGSGGAVANSGTLTMLNSTVYGSMFGEGGAGGPDNGRAGAPGNTGGILATGGTATLRYLTVASDAGDLTTAGGAVTLNDTIVASSTSGANCVGTIGEEGGYNLDSAESCGLSLSTDKSAVEPNLGPLAANGGPTETLALLPGSPAIDAGGTTMTGCPSVDQRGTARPDEAGDAGCDIGAYESQGVQ